MNGFWLGIILFLLMTVGVTHPTEDGESTSIAEAIVFSLTNER
jgi:formate/nitrite transporter FocA (FNT family)